MPGVEGRVAVVTGAAVGLGRGFADALAAKGARLAVCDLREEVHSLRDRGGEVFSQIADEPVELGPIKPP